MAPHPADSPHERALQDALSFAREAGELLLERFGGTPAAGLEFKGQVDLVTAADRDAEALILEGIRAGYPGVAILAEESLGERGERHETATTGPEAPGEGPLWIVDPLDGTTNFVHGYPIFAVSIAFRESGRTRAGVVHLPYVRETYQALAGGGAFLNGRPIRVSAAATLLESLLVTGFADVRERRPRTTLPVFESLMPRSRGIRRSGAAAYDLACVAAGRCDAFWELCLNPWDIAAGVLLIEEAGGTVTDFRGGPEFEARREIVASNGLVHEEVRRACLELAGE